MFPESWVYSPKFMNRSEKKRIYPCYYVAIINRWCLVYVSSYCWLKVVWLYVTWQIIKQLTVKDVHCDRSLFKLNFRLCERKPSFARKHPKHWNALEMFDRNIEFICNDSQTYARLLRITYSSIGKKMSNQISVGSKSKCYSELKSQTLWTTSSIKHYKFTCLWVSNS